jgi:hypothetical protein
MEWDKKLLRNIKEQEPVEPRRHGAKPSADIFHRPIVRSQKLFHNLDSKHLWNEVTTAIIFPNVLQAVQELSLYNSNPKVRNIEAIDEIKIANQVASCANGERLESFGYLWAWKEGLSQGGRVHDYQASDQYVTSNVFYNRLQRLGRRVPIKEGDHRSFLKYSCAMCAADTTVV